MFAAVSWGVLTIIFAVLVLALAIAAFVAALLSRCRPDPPELAPDKIQSNCGVPPGPQPDNQDYSLKTSDTKGVFAHRKITLDAGKRIDLTGSLTLVANEGIAIDGGIQNGGGDWDITLFTRGGELRVGGQGWIGFGTATAGGAKDVTDRYAKAASGPGSHGRTIKLEGPVVRVDGKVIGQDGGAGGEAHATGKGFWKYFGGCATAVSAQGGEGGDVFVCAVESIQIAPSGLVVSGSGGPGGFANAEADNGSAGYAEGGPGNRAGNVYLTVTVRASRDRSGRAYARPQEARPPEVGFVRPSGFESSRDPVEDCLPKEVSQWQAEFGALPRRRRRLRSSIGSCSARIGRAEGR